ncbi:PucR family transcriptional regulator [Nesterenkonia marinintestina]|uniref:PucR family transcriptional regulator n=1 Tax=Nesterenkonia marinintestina TaxID=2979865 RepID=UPI0021BF015A|nr:helix-turn-helix domain-containing protein [Nesterenkonia sp. GX14115]
MSAPWRALVQDAELDIKVLTTGSNSVPVTSVQSGWPPSGAEDLQGLILVVVGAPGEEGLSLPLTEPDGHETRPAGVVVCEVEPEATMPSWVEQLQRSGVGVALSGHNHSRVFEGLELACRRAVAHEQRKLHIVESLITSMASPDPVQSVVVGLATLFEGAALLYDTAGEVVQASGGAPVNLIRQAVASVAQEPTFEVGRWNLQRHELSIRTQNYTLVVGQRDVEGPDDLLSYALETVAQLLRSFQSLDSFARLQQIQISAQLLSELELGIPAARESHMWERLREFGFVPFEPLYLLTGAPMRMGERPSRGLTPVGEALSYSDAAVVVHERDSEYPGEGVFRVLTQDLAALSVLMDCGINPCAIGVSEPFTALADTPSQTRAAEMARTSAQRRMAFQDAIESVVVRVEEMRPIDWLLARTSSLRDDQRRTRYAEPLRGQPQLLETLLTHFSNSFDVARTAGQLHVHPNTVRYRVKQVEDLMDISLADPHDVTNLVLALYEDL